MVGPSGMMDGQVAEIREARDVGGFYQVGIIAYAAKFASSFYGPFREAAECAPRFGDRTGYQMDPPNADEAIREIASDIEQGADVVMVKPAIPYLDVIRLAKDETRFPMAAYNVSGEYAMVKAAAANGWLDERKAVLEVLTSIRRAGADLIRYVDLVQSWGALLFGHARPEIAEAAKAAAERGTSFGAPTELEVELAERITAVVPAVEQVRLVSSGTEAAMSAIRLSRGFTGRSLVLKFEGCYHGHSDALLAKGAGSGVATFGIPGSPGVTEGAARDTLTAPFNDLEAVRTMFEEHGERIAAVIVEPVAANMGVVPPEPGFLDGLRELCTARDALLVFDEVITGFRVGRGGAQERFGVLPDLTILGKIVGGGLPLAAFGGRADVMERFAPSGDVYQAGTLSGNPLATAAGLSVLRRLRDPAVYEELERRAAALADGLAEAAGEAAAVQRLGSLLTLFFRAGPVRNYDEAAAADTVRYGEFFRALLERGVFVPPSQFEAMFVSLAHGDGEFERTVEA